MLTNRFKDSFSLKVFRAFAISVIIVSTVFTLFFVYYESKVVKEELVQEGKMLAGLLAYGSRTGVFAENRELLEDTVRGIMSQKNVLAVSIYTAENNMLINERKGPLKNETVDITAEEKEMISQLGTGRLYEIIEGKDTISILSPVILEIFAHKEEALYFENTSPGKTENVIGYVKVILDRNIISQEMKSILFRSAIIAAAFLFLGAFIIYISIKRVTRPLVSLTDEVMLLGKGKSVKKVHVESRDEIGRLADAFNTMYDNLQKRDEEKQILEEKLRHAQKMEAIGTFARGVSHDFNNILSTAKGALHIIEKKLDEDSPLRNYTSQIHNSVKKASHLLQQLLTFSRTMEIHSKEIDINELIRMLKPMIANIAGEEIDVNFYFTDEKLLVMADALQMEQVLINLCLNARDAMPDGGLLKLETRPVTIDAEEAGKQYLKRPGRYALITVADNGMGMDEETKDRIFEPFFTTKEVGKGTGLGLSIVYGVIEQHNGSINVHTKKGEGAVFTICLPLVEKSKDDGGSNEISTQQKRYE